MKLPLVLSFLLCFLVALVSTAKISPRKNSNIDADIAKPDDKPLSRNAVSATSRSSKLTQQKMRLPSRERIWGHCTPQWGTCASYAPPCCGSLSCISHKCKYALCEGLNAHCGWGGTTCCGTLLCIHGKCKGPTPTPSPSPSPSCSRSHCGISQRCCNGFHCIAGICKGCIGNYERCGHGLPPCCSGGRCKHGRCIQHDVWNPKDWEDRGDRLIP